ncbi:MAG: SAM-dependent methyltransferase [Planctomycetota bacterium]|jgi:23S rRNA (cytidine1920-2'-O)/16S rRNA (cytidine1409-2'-O)-methyltransferase
MASGEERPYVSRAGAKLEHALRTFGLDVRGLVCADLGCHVGGFTDCLLRHGATRVYAVDTGYGILDWRLRNDERVVVMERTNALHAEPPEPVDLVVIDLGWTPQRHAIPAALRWLRPGGVVVSLVKPHYELDEREKRERLVDGRLDPGEADRVVRRVLDGLPAMGVEVVSHCRSPISGSKSGRGRRGLGNVEHLVLVRPRGGAADCRPAANEIE